MKNELHYVKQHLWRYCGDLCVVASRHFSVVKR